MLKARKWSKPIEATLRGAPISFELKILAFLEARPFQLVYSRIRFDVVAGELEKIGEEERAERRGLLARLEGAAAAAGVTVPAVDVPAGKDPLDVRIEAVASALSAAGVTLPDRPAAEIDAEVERLERSIQARNAALAKYADSVPAEWVREVFSKFVRNVSGLVDEETGAAVTDGAGLLEFADEELATFVIARLHRLSKVGEQEKNDSSSLSTSGPAAVTTDGTSGVGSVLSGDGTSREIAPAT